MLNLPFAAAPAAGPDVVSRAVAFVTFMLNLPFAAEKREGLLNTMSPKSPNADTGSLSMPPKSPNVGTGSSSLNIHALVVTSLRDELVNTFNICSANPEEYLRELPEEDVKLIATICKKHTKGAEPWFPLTRKYLGRLVYNVQLHKDLHKKLDPMRSILSKEEFRKYETKEMDELTRKYSDRMGKILNIVDPSLGEDWWSRVLSLRWQGESFATLEKLNLLAMSDVTNETKVFWLSLLEANKVTKAMFALPRGYHDYRGWLQREVTLEMIFMRALEVLRDLVDGPDSIVVPTECTLFEFYEEIKLEKRKFLFSMVKRVELKDKGVDANKSIKKLDMIQMAAQRLAYRFLFLLKENDHLLSIPLRAKKWLSINNEATTMYPPSMHTLSKWELDHCPWWIDLDGGEILEREKEVYANFEKQKSLDGLAMNMQDHDKERPHNGEPIEMDIEAMDSLFAKNIDVLPNCKSRDKDKMVEDTMRGGEQDLSVDDGLAPGLIDRHCRILGLEIWHRVLVIHHSPYGYVDLAGVMIECSTSMLFFVRRLDTDPPVHLAASTSHFMGFHTKPLDSVAYHHMLVSAQATGSDGAYLRASLERSSGFLRCYLELLCRPGGMVLELGCGTAPILRACLASGRICMALDSDERVLTEYVFPLLRRSDVEVRVGPSYVHSGDDMVDPLAGESPYD